MNSERNTIFIGHANPEDNEFTLWLHYKLTNEGYSVASDLVSLTGGESDFWKALQNLLNNKACKYLLVFSKSTFAKQGVIDEWEQVRAIARKKNLEDFIYLLKIDDVPFDARIGTVTMNQFRFDRSWADGLKKLTKKLHLDGVSKVSSALSVNDWLKNKYTTRGAGLRKKREKHHSNWIEIKAVPEKIYFYKYANESQAKAICDEIDTFPVIHHSDYLITFLNSVPTESFKNQLIIKPKRSFAVSTTKCFEYYKENNFPGFHDLRRFLIMLLKNSFELFLRDRGLLIYQLSGNSSCYFYGKGTLPDDRVNFYFEEKKTRKDLVGQYHDSFWHYGISLKPLLQPFFCIAVKGRLVFSSDGMSAWPDKDKQHSARRAKGRRFFNKEWRAMLIAFLHSLITNDSDIRFPATPSDAIVAASEPIVFYGDVGYDDPREKAREVPLDFFDDEQESDDNFETEYEQEK